MPRGVSIYPHFASRLLSLRCRFLRQAGLLLLLGLLRQPVLLVLLPLRLVGLLLVGLVRQPLLLLLLLVGRLLRNLNTNPEKRQTRRADTEGGGRSRPAGLRKAERSVQQNSSQLFYCEWRILVLYTISLSAS